MHAAVLRDCLAYLVGIVLCLLVARGLLTFCATRFRVRQLLLLHWDERGAVQSLSFVLTLPVFVLLMLSMVQLSQLAIARMTVEYAAYAAARSASVWIPADLGEWAEGANCLGVRLRRGAVRDERGIDFDVYSLHGPSLKKNKIDLAAAMALLPICPSSQTSSTTLHWGLGAFTSLNKAYHAAMAPSAAQNIRIPTRLQNKLAYALARTDVSLVIHHRQDEPSIDYRYDIGPNRDEFEPNEIGWQDQVLVTVTHDFALLPGPGRFLARRVVAPGRSADEVSERIRQRGNVFVYPVSATVRLSNEGEKPIVPFRQFSNTSTSIAVQ